MYPYLHIGKLLIPTFSLVMLASIAVSLAALLLYKKSYMSVKRRLIMLMPWILIAAGISGRLLSAIILTINTKESLWYNLLYGGCVFYGAVAGGVLAGYIFCRKYKLDFLSALDVSMTAIPLAQAIGRFGCWLNGCCYGCGYDGVLAVSYPVDGQMTSVFPTWFAESAVCFVIWLVIYSVPIKRRGAAAAMYCISYGIARFIIEFFRGDAVRGVFGVLSTSQYISIPLVLLGAAILILNKKQNCYIY